eukprot:7119355-Alexandrium_andersonii.AAC.1
MREKKLLELLRVGLPFPRTPQAGASGASGLSGYAPRSLRGAYRPLGPPRLKPPARRRRQSG